MPDAPQEHFLVPEPHVRSIRGSTVSLNRIHACFHADARESTHVHVHSGASFAGFYYIMFTRATGAIDGYYYHNNSERCVSRIFPCSPYTTYQRFPHTPLAMAA